MDKKFLTEILQSRINIKIQEKLIEKYFIEEGYSNPKPKLCKNCGIPIHYSSNQCRKCYGLGMANEKIVDYSKNAKYLQIVEMINSGKTLQEVGDKYKVTRERIRQIYLKATGLPTKKLRKNQEKIQYKQANCVYCGKEFLKKRKNRILCSRECRYEYSFYSQW